MNREDTKRYFETIPPPTEVLCKPWAKIVDSQLFLKSCDIGILNFNDIQDICPEWWHLKNFYNFIKRNNLQEKSNEEPME